MTRVHEPNLDSFLASSGEEVAALTESIHTEIGPEEPQVAGCGKTNGQPPMIEPASPEDALIRLSGGKVMTLTKDQNQAASYGTGTRAVVATAGAGKTSVQAVRIRRLLSRAGVRDEDVLATTFTRAGAVDLLSRIESMLGRRAKIQSGTIHSFCANLLMRHWEKLGYKLQPTILDDGERTKIIDKLMLIVAGVSKKDQITTFTKQDIDRWLTELSVREFSSDERDHDPLTKLYRPAGAVLEVCRLYSERSRQYGHIDFDGILTETLRLLRLNDKEVVSSLPYYVFVDESQDLSAIQWFIVEELAKNAISLDVIGDDDQSIYQWRRALPWRFRDFVARADHRFYLTANRRCARNIVDFAAGIIEAIPDNRRVKKDLSAVRDVEGVVRFSVIPTLRSLFLLAKKISTTVAEGKKTYSDYAFIARSTTRVFDEVEGALKRYEIPYKILGGLKSTFDRPEARLLKALANLVQQTAGGVESMLHWQSIMDECGVSPMASEKIIRSADDSGGQLSSVQWAIKESRISPQTKATVESLVQSVSTMRKTPGIKMGTIINNQVVSQIIDGLIVKGSERDMNARRQKEGGLTDEKMRELVSETIERRKSGFEDAHSLYLDMSVSAALVSLNLEMPDKDESGDVVTLTTAHSSKGLEFDTVFCLEVNDATWPSQMATKGLKSVPEAILRDISDEERRLLYVAVTRAKNELYMLTTLRHPMSDAPQIPSRFFPEWLKEEVGELFKSVAESGNSQGKHIQVPRRSNKNE